MKSVLSITLVLLAFVSSCTYEIQEPKETAMFDELDGSDGAFDERVNGWSASQALSTGQPFPTLSLQANFPKSGYYTVQFGVQAPSSGSYFATASITWSVEGNDVTRRINIGSGAVISGPGQAVKVVVTDATPAAYFTNAIGYTVTAQISPGSRPTGTTPPTIQCESVSIGGNPIVSCVGVPVTIPAGSNALFYVPSNAGATSVEVVGTNSDGSAASFVVTQLNSVALKQYLSIGAPGFVDLTPGVSGVFVLNQSGTKGAVVTVSFGVDG